MSVENSNANDDLTAAAVEVFAFHLRRARRDAGDLSLRQLADRIGRSASRGWGSSSTLQRAFAGRSLPSWPVVEALLVDGFGIDHERVHQEWRRRWVEVKDLVEPLDPPFPKDPKTDGVVVPLLKPA
ncbi:helix-turn-helix transcriptional regulator [Lentzea sp. NPDC034063]|uniref:helix-turn-helix domain-containing protein n=1 Tax=unclassified Lentzea TaxID=2643253 RepID=UPI0033D05043